jgi:hypothetical protein
MLVDLRELLAKLDTMLPEHGGEGTRTGDSQTVFPAYRKLRRVRLNLAVALLRLRD